MGAPSILGNRRLLLVAAGFVAATAVLIWQWEPFVTWLDVSQLLRSSSDVEPYLPVTVLSVLALAVILILERVLPVRRSQGTLSRGFCQDALWLLLAVPVGIFSAFWFSRGLEWLFDHPLADARIVDLDAYLPFGVVVVICFVFGDLLAWIYHYLKHKVPLFWRFHAIHHSAIELNPFTDSRVHLGEFFVNQTVAALPFFMIGGDASVTVSLFVLARLWYARFYHSNIRTNLGPLRHVLVTPQYHRLHHSVEERDADQNFGNFLTIWDRMFGTQVADPDRYPETGINDPNFPHPTSRSPFALLRTYWQQSIYPFRRPVPRFPATGSPQQG